MLQKPIYFSFKTGHQLETGLEFCPANQTAIDFITTEVQEGRNPDLSTWDIDALVHISDESNTPLFILMNAHLTGDGNCPICGGDTHDTGDGEICQTCNELIL